MSTEPIDDGGSAFPLPEDELHCVSPGMSLRDWFAGQALAGKPNFDQDFQRDAIYCYLMADAMLAERAKEEVK